VLEGLPSSRDVQSFCFQCNGQEGCGERTHSVKGVFYSQRHVLWCERLSVAIESVYKSGARKLVQWKSHLQKTKYQRAAKQVHSLNVNTVKIAGFTQNDLQ